MEDKKLSVGVGVQIGASTRLWLLVLVMVG